MCLRRAGFAAGVRGEGLACPQACALGLQRRAALASARPFACKGAPGRASVKKNAAARLLLRRAGKCLWQRQLGGRAVRGGKAGRMGVQQRPFCSAGEAVRARLAARAGPWRGFCKH